MSTLDDIVKAALSAATYHNGHRHTALRGVIGAGMLMGKVFPIDSIGAAAVATGVSVATIGACKTILGTEDPELLRDVLNGKPLIPTAQSVRVRARLISDYRCASSEDLLAMATTVGVDELFDRVIAPRLF
jgi:hypothetical protein